MNLQDLKIAETIQNAGGKNDGSVDSEFLIKGANGAKEAGHPVNL